MSSLAVSSRGDWRSLIALAQACVGDVVAAGQDADVPGADLRRMTLAARSRQVTFAVLEREAGATTAQVARAVIDLARAFANGAVSRETRAEVAPVLGAVVGLLEDLLHALATREFQRAHQGRPEVWR